MSGGRFDYINDTTCSDILGVYPDYGFEGKEYEENVKHVRERNLMKNELLSEMCYDMFCLLHSYDWAASGDTGWEDYEKDKKFFMNKYFKKDYKELINEEFEKRLKTFEEDFRKDFL